MKYVVSVRFSTFVPGEIIDIPDDNDIPQSFFDQGFFVPLEKPKKKVVKKDPVVKKPVNPSTTTSTTTGTTNNFNITYTPTNSAEGSKPDKLD